MKKILYSLILLIFFTTGFIYNSMDIFASNNKTLQKNIVNLSCNTGSGCNYTICSNESNTNNICLHSCCIGNKSSHVAININFSFNNTEKLKTKNYFFLNFKDFDIFAIDNKRLIGIHSPPYINRKIRNYNYHNLVKIIKSNI